MPGSQGVDARERDESAGCPPKRCPGQGYHRKGYQHHVSKHISASPSRAHTPRAQYDLRRRLLWRARRVADVAAYTGSHARVRAAHGPGQGYPQRWCGRRRPHWRCPPGGYCQLQQRAGDHHLQPDGVEGRGRRRALPWHHRHLGREGRDQPPGRRGGVALLAVAVPRGSDQGVRRRGQAHLLREAAGDGPHRDHRGRQLRPQEGRQAHDRPAAPLRPQLPPHQAGAPPTLPPPRRPKRHRPSATRAHTQPPAPLPRRASTRARSAT